ncbi:MAG: hypothetical protein J6N76_03810, partial [Lachnospiraceae bacterium]|nr:hypothetical protein [Lachnospiraceae bacterium]
MRKRFYSKHKLQSILLIWLNTIMIVAFIIATVIGLFMQNKMQQEHIFSIMDSYLQDCVKDIDVPGEVDYY